MGNDLIFVVGSGRSGSSAVTRTISLCGYQLPDELFGPNVGNELGYFEPVQVVALNDYILKKMGIIWSDPVFPDEFFKSIEEIAEDVVEKIVEFLGTLNGHGSYVVKDGRISLLAPLWVTAAQRQGWNIKFVHVFRKPFEVIQSYQRFAKLSPAQAADVWLRYNTFAEINSRGFDRAFLSYNHLLMDWRKEITNLSNQAGIKICPQINEIDKFLTSALYRERGSELSGSYYDTKLLQTYEMLMDARSYIGI
jgi:hypothetical protein